MSINSKEISNLRQNYSMNTLNKANVSENPIELFQDWFTDAISSGIIEPNAMVLSTVFENVPRSRTVLLKGMDKNGFVFYTNYNSAKGKEMEINPNVSILFFWDKLERQVRIEGIVDKVLTSISDEYFNSRPRGSQIGAWVSNQSEVIEGVEILEESERFFQEKFQNDEIIPRPPHWGGYLVKPTMIEFWQGRPSRLHDRLRYIKSENDWLIDRLSP